MLIPVFADPCAEFAKLPERFREKIYRVEPFASGCWLWLGRVSYQGDPDPCNADAYGRVDWKGPLDAKRRNWLAHRATYTIIVGEIPKFYGDPMVLDHRTDRCSLRRCVRPDHLEPITSHANTVRGFAYRNGVPHFSEDQPSLLECETC